MVRFSIRKFSLSALRRHDASLLSETMSELDVDLSELQGEMLTTVLYHHTKDGRTAPRQTKCHPDRHVSVCGHAYKRLDGGGMPCTNGCFENGPFAGNKGSERKFMQDLTNNHAILERFQAISSSSNYKEEADKLNASHTTEKFEGLPICPQCYLKECLMRFYFFAVETQLPKQGLVYDSAEIVPNFIDIALFPEVIELSHSGHFWTGPKVILDIYKHGWEHGSLLKTINRGMLDRDIDTPLDSLEELEIDQEAITIVADNGEYIRELRLVSSKQHTKKQVHWGENVVHIIPARESIDQEQIEEGTADGRVDREARECTYPTGRPSTTTADPRYACSAGSVAEPTLKMKHLAHVLSLE